MDPFTPLTGGTVQIAPEGTDPDGPDGWTDIGYVTPDGLTLTEPVPDPAWAAFSSTWPRNMGLDTVWSFDASVLDDVFPPQTLSTDDLAGVHDPAACEGQGCVVHHPSGHHMRYWPVAWCTSHGIAERVCEHGIGHPDPDEVAFLRQVAEYAPNSLVRMEAGERAAGIHDCDGCCHTPTASASHTDAATSHTGAGR